MTKQFIRIKGMYYLKRRKCLKIVISPDLMHAFQNGFPHEKGNIPFLLLGISAVLCMNVMTVE